MKYTMVEAVSERVGSELPSGMERREDRYVRGVITGNGNVLLVLTVIHIFYSKLHLLHY